MRRLFLGPKASTVVCSRLFALLLVLALGLVARAELPQSPYLITWSFPGDEPSAIEIDRGDLSVSRFASAIELAQYLGGLAKKKRARPKATDGVAPARELRVDQLDSAGGVRATARYTLPLAEWRLRLGERMVERLEDEFDAHLRMLLPRKTAPKPLSPRSPPDLGAGGSP